MDATIASIKSTLRENPAEMPPTPEAPLTLEGSLQPSQAITDEADVRKYKTVNGNRRPIRKTNYLLLSATQEASQLSQQLRNHLVSAPIVIAADPALPVNQNETRECAGRGARSVIYRVRG